MLKRYIKNILHRILHPSCIKLQNGGSLQCDLSVCLKNCTIIVRGKGTSVVIGKDSVLSGVHIFVNGEDSHLVIGKNVHINASIYQPTHINAFGHKRKVLIGDNCLISNNVEIHTSDYHKIFDGNGNRVNENKNVIIGNNVWIGLRSIILKGHHWRKHIDCRRIENRKFYCRRLPA